MAIEKYNFIKVSLAGSVAATYAWLGIDHFEKRRHGNGGTRMLNGYKCIAEAGAVVAQLCKCADCGMKASSPVEFR